MTLTDKHTLLTQSGMELTDGRPAERHLELTENCRCGRRDDRARAATRASRELATRDSYLRVAAATRGTLSLLGVGAFSSDRWRASRARAYRIDEAPTPEGSFEEMERRRTRAMRQKKRDAEPEREEEEKKDGSARTGGNLSVEDGGTYAPAPAREDQRVER